MGILITHAGGASSTAHLLRWAQEWKHGGQLFRYKDVLKRHMKNCGIEPSQWEELALKRRDWRALITIKVQAVGVHRCIALDTKRDELKAQDPSTCGYQLYFKKRCSSMSAMRTHVSEKDWLHQPQQSSRTSKLKQSLWSITVWNSLCNLVCNFVIRNLIRKRLKFAVNFLYIN